MKITSVAIENFLSIGEIDTVLDRPGLNLVLGKNLDNPSFDSNGSAKSAFFEAVIWGLFGEIVRGVSIDEVVRKGQSSCSVILTVDPEDGSSPLVISRQRLKNRTVLEVTSNKGQMFPANSIKDKQKLLEEWLGIDYNTFINSVYFGKGLTKFFMTSNDNDRKEVLESILQLISFDKPFENAKDALKLLLIEEDRLKGEISYYEKWANETDRQLNLVLVEKEKLKAQDEEATSATVEITKIINKIGMYKLDVDVLADHIGALLRQQEKAVETIQQEVMVKAQFIQDDNKKEFEEINIQAAAAKSALQKTFDDQKANLLQEMSEVIKVRDEAKHRFRFYEDALAVSRAEASRLKNEITKVRDNRAGTKCPKCYNTIDEGHIASVVAGFENGLAEAEKQINMLVASCFDVTETILKPIEIALKELEQEQEELLKLHNTQMLSLRDEVAEKKAASLARKSAAEKELLKTKADKEKALLSAIRAEMDSDQKEKTNKLLEIKDLERKQAELQAFTTSHYKVMASIDSRIADQNKLKLDSVNKTMEFVSLLEKVRKEKPLLEFTVEAFSPKGIRSLIFENALPFITERANYYSTYLTGGTVKIEITPTTTTRTTGETKEKLSVSAKNTVGADIYSGNSDGERRRIDVCILLALQDLIGTRSNKTWNIAIYDEIADALDATGIQNLIDLFRNIASDKSIYIISHSSDMRQFFDIAMTFVKEEGISRLETT